MFELQNYCDEETYTDHEAGDCHSDDNLLNPQETNVNGFLDGIRTNEVLEDIDEEDEDDYDQSEQEVNVSTSLENLDFEFSDEAENMETELKCTTFLENDCSQVENDLNCDRKMGIGDASENQLSLEKLVLPLKPAPGALQSETMDEEKLQTPLSESIGFIGGGNMARTIFDGLIERNVVRPDRVCVSGPHLENLAHFKERGAVVTNDNGETVDRCAIILICVKPQMLNKLEFGKNTRHLRDRLIISILAGTSMDTIESVINLRFSIQSIPSLGPMRLVRVMPNTPMAVGEGCCVFSTKNCELIDKQIVKTIFGSIGLCIEVSESQINAIAAVSGSGPAYMYLVLEAMADGGVKMGIPRQLAVKLAAQTMLGAAKMAQMSSKHTAELKDEVCSAGGTTITGMYALEKGGVRGAFIDAIENATKRAFELDQSTQNKK